MILACPPIERFSFYNFVAGDCRAKAFLFYKLVSASSGDGPYEDARNRQLAHEATSTCIARCPTTQESGGQGVTVLTIDLQRSSGSFPPSYEMYTIPDELTIAYDGNIIFSTDGLVSGFRFTTVHFSGSSTIIVVTIHAPHAGTAWDVHVGCPTDS